MKQLELSSTEEEQLKKIIHNNGYHRSKFDNNKYLSNCPLHPFIDFQDYELLKFRLNENNHFTALQCRRCQAEGNPWQGYELAKRILKGDVQNAKI